MLERLFGFMLTALLLSAFVAPEPVTEATKVTVTVPCREAGHTLENVFYRWEQDIDGSGHIACYGDITLTGYPFPYRSWDAYLDHLWGK
jgi:hypothetical protein